MLRGTVVCDLDGVVYLDHVEVAGSGEALARLDAAGYRLLFSTNNSWRTRADTAAKIATVSGYPARPDQVVSSALAAARLLVGSVQRAFVVGGAGLHEALTGEAIEPVDDWHDAEAVVVGLDLDLSYAKLAAATRAVHGGARLVASNTDATLPTPDGLLPGAGSIVAALETATGRTAEVAGKPHEPMRRLLSERIGTGPVWVVGDRADTDLALARAGGWTGVLVLTGVTRDPGSADPAADLVTGSLAEFAGRLLQA
jgi:4-nitrophenyl phosphatase